MLPAGYDNPAPNLKDPGLSPGCPVLQRPYPLRDFLLTCFCGGSPPGEVPGKGRKPPVAEGRCGGLALEKGAGHVRLEGGKGGAVQATSICRGKELYDRYCESEKEKRLLTELCFNIKPPFG